MRLLPGDAALTHGVFVRAGLKWKPGGGLLDQRGAGRGLGNVSSKPPAGCSTATSHSAMSEPQRQQLSEQGCPVLH